MTGARRTADDRRDATDRNHLERSGRVWDRWSRFYGAGESDFDPILDAAVERLGIEAGDAVLEVGCGPGTNFERLRDAVGPDGRIVAVDYSPEMVDRARERVAEQGWTNVDVIRADASSVAFAPARFDAALASLSMSVVPGATVAAQRVHDALVPGGRFAVFDLRLVPSGLLRVVNPLLSLFFRWFANWNPDEDVIGALRSTFETVDVEATYAAGVAYRALATKTTEAPEH